MEIINQRLSLQEFKNYLTDYDFGPQRPNKLVIHHTWKPTVETWKGEMSILGLKNYYEGKGWPAGPHLFIAEDGIWLFSPMNKDGIHAAELNPGSIGIEVVGDYDIKKWEGETKKNALGSIKALMDRLLLTDRNIFFHRDVSAKSCPGWAITKEWLMSELRAYYTNERLSESTKIPEENNEDKMVILKVPRWAKESVDFINEKKLFDIESPEDVRDAVKFHRFYQLINSEFTEE